MRVSPNRPVKLIGAALVVAGTATAVVVSGLPSQAATKPEHRQAAAAKAAKQEARKERKQAERKADRKAQRQAAKPAAAAAGPVAGFAIPNPGVINTGTKWVVLSTGSWSSSGHAASADGVRGPWMRTNKHFLTKRPAWSSKGDHSYWAPSIVRATDGRYVVYYAGVVAGQSSARCIGTAVGKSATGPFVPNSRALACWNHSGANAFDSIKSEGRNFSLIDPTPAQVGSTLVLTYKTQFRRADHRWHTTTRMVQLDPAKPWRTVSSPVSKGSIKITDAVNKYIEENPVLIARNGKLTLFTSFGWYGTCNYYTRYRQNTALWTGWLKKNPTRLAVPGNTCGTGNAQVVQAGGNDTWRFFFNAHANGPHTPFLLWVGNLTWSNGNPHIKNLL